MKPLTDREKIELVLKLDNASQRTAQTNKGYKKLDRLVKAMKLKLKIAFARNLFNPTEQK